MSYRASQLRHIANKLCQTGCGRPIAEGSKSSCGECLEKGRQKKQSHVANKLCQTGCGRPIAEGSKSRCEACATKDALRKYKTRARKKGLPFDLELSDLTPPEHCPACKVKLEKGTNGGTWNSPSGDRIFPKDGYVKSNFWYLCNSCNTRKSNLDPVGNVIHAFKIYAVIANEHVNLGLQLAAKEEIEMALERCKSFQEKAHAWLTRSRTPGTTLTGEVSSVPSGETGDGVLLPEGQSEVSDGVQDLPLRKKPRAVSVKGKQIQGNEAGVLRAKPRADTPVAEGSRKRRSAA